MSEKARVLLIVAVILGLALAVSSLSRAEQCPPDEDAPVDLVYKVSGEFFLKMLQEGSNMDSNDTGTLLIVTVAGKMFHKVMVAETQEMYLGIFAVVEYGVPGKPEFAPRCEFVGIPWEKVPKDISEEWK